MYWLRRPPYLRWITAGLLIAFGFLFEMRPTATELYPFTVTDLAPGQPIVDGLEWREIPAGVLPKYDGDPDARAALAIPKGEPLPSWAGAQATVPADWWALSIPLPGPAVPGSAIRVVLTGGTIVEGIIMDAGIENGFETYSMVGFPASEAPQVAQAAANDTLIVMIGSTSNGNVPNG